MSVIAWHGDPELKARAVERMREHREADALTRGFYQALDGRLPLGYRGCAIGCLLDRQPAAPEIDGWCAECQSRSCVVCVADPDAGWHEEVQRVFGIHWFVAERIDGTFESFDSHKEASDFAVAIVEAIPVGADLSGVRDAWEAWTESLTDDEYFNVNGRGQKLFELIAAAPVVSDVD